jgi:hypothetical protein
MVVQPLAPPGGPSERMTVRGWSGGWGRLSSCPPQPPTAAGPHAGRQRRPLRQWPATSPTRSWPNPTTRRSLPRPRLPPRGVARLDAWCCAAGMYPHGGRNVLVCAGDDRHTRGVRVRAVGRCAARAGADLGGVFVRDGMSASPDERRLPDRRLRAIACPRGGDDSCGPLLAQTPRGRSVCREVCGNLVGRCALA